MRAFPFALCDEKYWYRDKRDMPWEAFEPMMEKMDALRRDMFADVIRLLIVDETMVPWKPKRSEKGGSPHNVLITTKPHDYGPLIRNACEALTCIITAQEFVKDSELEDGKKYTLEESHMPDKSRIKQHVGECLRLAENSGLTPGSFECGDSHFGSVECVVENMIILKIFSTYIVKQNSFWYPKAPLKRVMNARHGLKRQGKWVVMTATISGVDLMAIAYSWHSSGEPSFFISSCGSSAPADAVKITQVETGVGGFARKLVPQPKICAFVLPLLSVVDEHNKKHCRKELPIYESWPTKFVWFRLVCCLLGESIVDELHGFKRHDRSTWQNASTKEFVEHAVASARLRPWPRAVVHGPDARTRNQVPFRQRLVRIVNRDGEENHDVSANDSLGGRYTGRNRNNNCWMCRKYYRKYKPTTFCCHDCGTPICNVDRTGDTAADGSIRRQSCRWEHYNSNDPEIRCNGRVKKGRFNADLKLY